MNYKTITDIIGKGILAGTMAFGGMLPSYGEEAKAPQKQEKTIQEMVDEMHKDVKKQLRNFPNELRETEEFMRRTLEMLKKPQRDADKYEAKVDAYCNLSSSQRYDLGLTAFLKDKKLNQRLTQEYGIEDKGEKVTIQVPDFIITPNGVQRPKRTVEVQSFQDLVELKVTDSKGNVIQEPSRNVKYGVLKFHSEMLNAGNDIYVGDSPSGHLGNMKDVGVILNQNVELRNSYFKK